MNFYIKTSRYNFKFGAQHEEENGRWRKLSLNIHKPLFPPDFFGGGDINPNLSFSTPTPGELYSFSERHSVYEWDSVSERHSVMYGNVLYGNDEWLW